MIRALVVDDEPLARDVLRFFLDDEPDVLLVGESANGREAAAAIRQEEPDLVFLDVRMPDQSGLDVIAEIGPENMPAVIFVTAFDEHAVEAFELHAVDYLLKPVAEERLRQAVARARERFRLRQIEDAAGQ
ncbi:MAG: response regulator, partial [Acidobacteriota bacterium]